MLPGKEISQKRFLRKFKTGNQIVISKLESGLSS
jgi:hypothetical protein